MTINKYVNIRNIEKCKKIDKYCLRCGTSINLEVHHIVSKGAIGGRNDSLWNLILLCHRCHHIVQLDRKEMIRVLEMYKNGMLWRWEQSYNYIYFKQHKQFPKGKE